MKKIMCIVVTLLLLSSITAIVTGNEADNKLNTNLSNTMKQTIKSIGKNIIGTTNLDGNILISVNDENDNHPRMTVNSVGDIVVVYEQYIDLFSQQIPVCYSADGGQTWIMQFLFDSIDFTDGSGTLQYPDIVYNAPNDILFLAMIDPYADMYNNEMAYIPGDIANAEEASWYGISGTGATNYMYCAGECTDNFFISLTTEEDYGIEQLFGLGYFTYPDFETPPTMGGFYYDGQSEHQSAPAAEIEMDKNANRIFIVCETENQITIKSTVNDEALLTNGETQHGMDKYADIEQYPGEYLGDGSDPDVSGSGNKVAVVYVQGGAVKCSYSTCDAGTYDPGFNWQVSTVDTGATTPAVYMSGDSVYCAYVKDGNLFMKISEDAGATWGEAIQLNDVDGTVVADKGAVDIGKSGVVFTDNRNGNYDIYYSILIGEGVPPSNPTATYDKDNDELTVTSTDPDGDQIRYGVSWNNDQNVDEWTSFVNSGTSAKIDCGGRTGTVGVIAEDSNGLQSGWTSIAPKNKPMGLQLLLMELFPQLYKLIQNLLQL